MSKLEEIQGNGFLFLQSGHNLYSISESKFELSLTSQALHLTTSIPFINSPSSFDLSSVLRKAFFRRRAETLTRYAY